MTTRRKAGRTPYTRIRDEGESTQAMLEAQAKARATKQSKVAARRQGIRDLLEQGVSRADILIQCVNEYGMGMATVYRHFAAIEKTKNVTNGRKALIVDKNCQVTECENDPLLG